MSAATKPEPGTAVSTVAADQPSYIVRSPIGKILTAPAASSILSKALPAGATIDRFLYECYHAVTQNPEILECSEQSIILAVGRAIETGLVIGRGVYLVPVNTKVSKKSEPDRWEKRLQMWLAYQGEIELVRRAGVARHVDGHCVYSNEPFVMHLGTNPSVEHTPILDGTKRGHLIGGYAYALLPGQLLKVFHVTIEEVDAVRAKSKSWKSLAATPPWYVIKTAIHRVVRTLPTNPALRRVIAMMEREELQDTGEGSDVDGVDGDRASGAGDRPARTHERTHQLTDGRSVLPASQTRLTEPDNPYSDPDFASAPTAAHPVRELVPERAPDRTAAQRATAARVAATARDPFEDGENGEEHTDADDPTLGGTTSAPTNALPVYGQSRFVMRFGGEFVGKEMRYVPTEELAKLLAWAMRVSKGNHAAFIEAATAELDDRRLDAEVAASEG